MRIHVKTIGWLVLAVFLLPVGVRAAIYYAGEHPRSWRDANWSSADLLTRRVRSAGASWCFRPHRG